MTPFDIGDRDFFFRWKLVQEGWEILKDESIVVPNGKRCKGNE